MKKIIVALIVLFIIFVPKELKAASVKVKGVPVFNQYPELPTGCEATSLAMLLNWGGVSVSKFDVADRLPKGPKVKEVNGKWTGGNPNVAFVGDPYSEKDGSFGVFEGPILQTINTYLPGKGVNLTGQSFNSLLSIVENGKPLMVWTTIDQKQTYLSASWKDEAGNTVNWYRYEHAVVLTGVDGENVIVHDPYTGGVEHYNRSLFERNWASMGKRAVTLDLPPGDIVEDKPAEVEATAVKVKESDDKIVQLSTTKNETKPEDTPEVEEANEAEQEVPSENEPEPELLAAETVEGEEKENPQQEQLDEDMKQFWVKTVSDVALAYKVTFNYFSTLVSRIDFYYLVRAAF